MKGRGSERTKGKHGKGVIKYGKEEGESTGKGEQERGNISVFVIEES